MSLPQFVECGCCGHFHPVDFWGDCRDDNNRFTANDLDDQYGENQWKEIPLPDPGFAEDQVMEGEVEEWQN